MVIACFIDGPAGGVELQLSRIPLLIRAVRSAAGQWDALDLLTDEAKPNETIVAYRLQETPSTGMVDYRGPRGRRCGGPLAMVRYSVLSDQPLELQMRATADWQRWTLAHAEELTPAWWRNWIDRKRAAQRAGQ